MNQQHHSRQLIHHHFARHPYPFLEPEPVPEPGAPEAYRYKDPVGDRNPEAEKQVTKTETEAGA